MLIEKGAQQAVKDGDIPLKDLKKFVEAIELYKNIEAKVDPLPHLDNHWVYGQSGVGKSRSQRQRYQSIYIKAPDSEWWTGYNGQETVLIDDFEPFNKSLSGMLKRAADHYPFQARVHGHQQLIRPQRIVVTSNYHPDQIWKEEEQLQPILRRFTIMHMTPTRTVIERKARME